MMLINRNRFVAKSIWARTISKAAKNPATASSSGAGSQLTQCSEQTKSDVDTTVNLAGANIITRLKKKLPERPPLVKNFFVSIVDRNLLAFPEVLEKEDLNKLTLSLRPVADFFANKNKENPVLPVEDLKNMGSLSGSVSEAFGGRSHVSTETCLTGEAEGVAPSNALLINAHRLVIDAINEHGSVEQQEKYLPQLASGELMGTVCIFEANTNPEATTNTTAVLSGNETEWIINGNCFNL